jgi:hypothetical protein
MLNRLARVATLDGRIDWRVYAAGVQLAYRDTDRARLPLQYVEVVFEGVRQCTVLCSDQQQHQQQIGG